MGVTLLVEKHAVMGIFHVWSPVRVVIISILSETFIVHIHIPDVPMIVVASSSWE